MRRFTILPFLIMAIPLIDVVTSLNERLHFLPFSLGAIIKTIFLIAGIIILIIYSLKNKNKNYLLAGSLVLIYYVLHLFVSGALESNKTLLLDTQTILKYFSLPIFSLSLYILYKNNSRNTKNLPIAILVSAIIYSVFIIIPTILSLNYPSYGYTREGSTGWYYAANELGPILLLHLFAILQISKQKSKKLLCFIASLLCVSSVVLLETKTAIFSLIIIIIVDFIVSTINFNKKACLNRLFLLLFSVLMLFYTQTFSKTISPLLAKLQTTTSTVSVNTNDNPQPTLSNDNNKIISTVPVKKDIKENLLKKIFSKADTLMSHRLTTTRKIYSENNLQLKHLLFGKTEITLSGENRTAEIDCVDILLRLGFLGFIIYLAAIIVFFKQFFRSSPRDYIFKEYIFFFALIAILSTLAGHILTSPSVCFYLSLIALLPMRTAKNKTKIPKIIHYVWVGNAKKTRTIKRCIKSWKKYLVGYRIIEWNEKNFKINQHPFLKAAYRAKKWAFVSDYIRAFVIYHEGGIYLDTDVLLLDNFDALLNNDAFVGFENKNHPFTAAFGAKKKHPFVKKMLDYYDNLKTYDFDFSSNNTISVSNILTSEYQCIKNNQFQILKDGIAVYPDTVLCNPSKDSISIHIFTGTWLKEKKTFKNKLIVFIKSHLHSKLAAELYRKNFSRSKK